MTEQVEQRICIKFCIKLDHSSAETIQMIQEAAAMGFWWLAASSDNAPAHALQLVQFFGETSNQPGDSAPLQPRFGTLQLLAFPKTKITFEREEISDCQWDLGKYDSTADGNWENYLRSQDAYFEGDASLSYVQCFLYLVSSSINASIFHSTWLDTLWKDLTSLSSSSQPIKLASSLT